jgi:hypothetical protein
MNGIIIYAIMRKYGNEKSDKKEKRKEEEGCCKKGKK